MPSERAIVETLNRKELLALVDHFDIAVGDRRVRDNLVSALAASRRTPITEVLGRLSLASLKDVCRKHGLDDSGRLKTQLVERIVAGTAARGKRGAAKKAATSPSRRAAGAAKKTAGAGKRVVAGAAARTRATKPTSSKPAARPAGRVAATKATAPKRKAAGRGVKAAAVATPAARRARPTGAEGRAGRRKAAARDTQTTARAPTARASRGKTAKAASAKHGDSGAPAVPKTAPKAATAVPGTASLQGPPVEAAPQLFTLPPGHPAAGKQILSRDALMPELPSFAPTTSVQKCQSCARKLELRKCSAQRCKTLLVVNPSRKICAECLFERNTLSMIEFNQRLEEEGKCPHCGNPWQRAS